MYQPRNRDHFRVLGLPRSAGPHEVRAAFRALVKALHPDLNRDPTCRQRFIDVVYAYRELQQELDLLADGPPLPVIETVRHVSVVSLYALSLVRLARSAVTGSASPAVGSLAAAALRLLVLAATCVRVHEVQ